MNRIIKSANINGEVDAPPSKSLMQRAVAASLLREGPTTILNPSLCQDSMATINVVKKLGADIHFESNFIQINGGLNPSGEILDCGEAGLCMRMFSAIASLCDTELMLEGKGSLNSRPVFMIEKPLLELGVRVKTNNGYPPLCVQGPLKGGKATIDGSVSSQFLTGLLLALPKAKNDTELLVNRLKSKPYIDMTIQLLHDFGVNIQHSNYEMFFIKGNQRFKREKYIIEGDWSGASFLLVGGALGGYVKVSELDVHSMQADKKILDVLKSAGAAVKVNPGTVEVKHRELKPFVFDATDCPDLFPPLVVLACFCKGTSVIRGVDRLRYKESDRASVLKTEFSSLGADIKINKDQMEIKGKKIKGGAIHSHNDHRIVMAAAIAAINTEKKIVIKNVECVSKSYPDFFKDFVSIGGEVYE